MATDRQTFVTPKQSHQLMATFATNADWDHVDPIMAQQMIRNPVRAGELFAAFVNRGLDFCWREHGGMISFTLTSNGWTGERWLRWFKKKGYRVSIRVREVLLSSDFRPAPIGTLYKVTMIRGAVFKGVPCTYDDIRAYARNFGLFVLAPETICLACKAIPDEDMKAMGAQSIFGMHEPVVVSSGSFRLWFAPLENGSRLVSDDSSCARIGFRPDACFAFSAV